ncbi:FFLEELY motif protein [Rhodoferax aquaticus]|uniref:DUF8198 domain-containing protein n=1 Tax=Rhodoferax aquaticus TaxID=2527691 RepID=A0A515ETS4_9BURK|nr:hypothetical protein [Rhodoferax aquaticus]QDL56051.1 hypothetical protein EXZ61_18740 [Rhodoferax aquaticus]
MTSHETIAKALAKVNALREAQVVAPRLGDAVIQIKQLQARRFEGTYRDLLRSEDFGDAARFFLTELYAAKDYSARDQQFSRIAKTIEKVFPASVIQTATQMASVHCLTEELDQAMGACWLEQPLDRDPVSRYIDCWRFVGARHERSTQLLGVLKLGKDLTQLTNTVGLSTLLKLMRRPAHLAGLESLQTFLETGFETFKTMSRCNDSTGAGYFLNQVRDREEAWITRFFDGPTDEVTSSLRHCLANT